PPGTRASRPRTAAAAAHPAGAACPQASGLAARLMVLRRHRGDYPPAVLYGCLRPRRDCEASLLVEGDGGPLAVGLAGANVPAVHGLGESLDANFVAGPEPAPDFEQHLTLDRDSVLSRVGECW